ncbi:haloacid dehalogenase-like hydrolase [Clostridioides difficile]
MKRIFELTNGDIEVLNKNDLKNIIKNSEGRSVMAETIISYTPYIKEVSNPELAASFGADMITLNTFNFEKPYVFGFGEANLSNGLENTFKIISDEIKSNINDKNYIRNIRSLVGRLIGVNLEPVPEGSTYENGYRLNRENLQKVKEYGFNYIVITGNPSTGVNEQTICEGIKLAKDILGDSTLIIAGKMHGAGSGNIYDTNVVRSFVNCGADVVLIPAPGTVPGITEDLAKEMIDAIHEEGALAMTTIGTSQEGSSESVIEKIALMSKMAGADIQHIGDCATFGMALPENIMKLSVTIRGIRHTYRRMAQSIKR